MKKIFFTLAVVATLASCKKNPEEITEPVKPLSPDIDLAISGAAKESQAPYPSSITYNYLGYGYDVTENFNNETSIRASVVDMPNFDADPLHSVDLSRGTEFSWKNIVAQNALDLSEKFSNSITQTKGLKVFGNTIVDAFPSASVTDAKYVYGYYSNYMIRKTLRFYYDQSVNKFISNQFKQDVNLLNAESIIKKYGTHVLIGINLGAKFDVFYQAVAGKGDKQMISMEGQRYAVKTTFGLETGYLDKVDLQNLNANSSAQVYYNSIGGDSKMLKSQVFNSGRVFINITNWINSATENNARFIGTLQNGLVPIYNLIDDETKKAQLKAYFDSYILQKTVKLN